MPFPIGAALAGASAVGNFFGAKANRRHQTKTQEKEFAHNRQMSEYAYSKDLEQYERQNKYNRPEAQMDRLKAAGLNPNLVYGTGAVANTQGQTPQYNAPRADYTSTPIDFGGVLGNFQDVQLKQAQIDNIKANTESVEASTGITQTEQILKDMEADIAKQNQWYTRVKVGDEHKIRRRQMRFDSAKYDSQLQQIKNTASGSELKLREQELKNELLDWKIKDAKSPLTKEGRARVIAILAGLKGLGLIDAKWVNNFLLKAKGKTMRDILNSLE